MYPCFQETTVSTHPSTFKKGLQHSSPKDLSILTRLRVELSKLNFHKFKRNLSDTLNPSCQINDGTEDTEHFLLLCHAYDED